MDRTSSITKILIVICACLVLVACGTDQSGMSSTGASGTAVAASKSGGHLIVHRAANLGAFIVTLTLDGKPLARVELDGTYEGYLTPGRHVLTAVPTPNRVDQAPASVTLMVENGKTYSFTADWQADTLILTRDS